MTRTRPLPIYMDCAATTPVDPRVVAAMLPWLRDQFGNPASSTHPWGWEARKAVDTARRQVAALVGADAQEIVWTSGVTESDNLALKGAAQFHRNRGRHVITVATEHKAVLDTLHALEQESFQVTYLGVGSDGLLNLDEFQAALRSDTVLASVMLVNNEVGVIQDVAAIGALCRERGVIFHVDAAQATGKMPIDVHALPVDLMSLASHKTYGPKGIGALYVCRRPRVRLQAQMHGGGHEGGLRSGTLPTHQIVGMGEAFRIAKEELDQDDTRARALHRRFLDGLRDVPGFHLNGDAIRRVPQNLNIRFDGVSGEALMLALQDVVSVSSGSACTSANPEPSHVLRALGLTDEQAGASLRMTFGRFTTEAEIDTVVRALRENVERLRRLPAGDSERTHPGC
ncbi:MAG: IscS subfamily cysteine desulfurase [Burkholderiaceae bacterium]|nr:MAG: IscS subfamily cysteine desulfurase [Burkholderiaceae bacterium]